MRQVTEKQLRFAHHVADGSTLADAYRRAYDTNGNSNTVRVEGCRLARNSGVIAAVSEIQRRARIDETTTGSADLDRLLHQARCATSSRERLKALNRLSKKMGMR